LARQGNVGCNLCAPPLNQAFPNQVDESFQIYRR